MVYGDIRLNSEQLWKYGLTIEFVEKFNGIKYSDIELTSTMILSFWKFIKKNPVSKLFKTNYIKEKNHQFYSFKDVQQILFRAPPQKEDLSKEEGRKTILMPASLLNLALKEFKNDKVILYISNKIDKITIEENKRKLPGNFEVFNITERVDSVDIPMYLLKEILNKVDQVINANKEHEVFGTKEFSEWLKDQLIGQMKQIHSLEKLILNKPIKVIIDLNEFIVPGNILSLLSLKYGLSYIYLQNFFISDVNIIPSRATYYCMWGKNYKEWLEKRGIDSNKIIPIGCFRFEQELDSFSKYLSDSEFRELLDIPSDHYIITVALQRPFSVNTKILTWLDENIQSLPITIVVKAHPFDQTDYSRFSSSKIKFPPKNLHLYQLLKNTDFLLTIFSNVGVEAAMFKKGIVVLQPNKNMEYSVKSHLAKASAGYIANNETELFIILKKLTESKEYRDNLIEEGQKFLENTLQTKIPPSSLIANLVRKLI